MKALGMIEVYSFTTAVCVADLCAKTADVRVIAFDRNRPIRTDVPAPLVMEVKIEGDTSAVQSAIAAAKKYAEGQGKYIVSHVIAHPDDKTEPMAYLLDINRDKFNKKLGKKAPVVDQDTNYSAIGIIEVQGLVAAISGLDEMLKAANVRVIHTEKRLGGRLVTFIVTGEVAAVKAGVEAGCNGSRKLGDIYGCEVIARPHAEIMKFFDLEV